MLILLNKYIDCEEYQPFPWAQLSSITLETVYGCHVADQWDYRCLKTVLENIISDQFYDVLKSDIVYGNIDDYKNIAADMSTELFGEITKNHSDIEKNCDIRKYQFLLTTIQSSHPKKHDIENEEAECLDLIYDIRSALIRSIEVKELDLDEDVASLFYM